ncbi:MAG: nucleotidyltransferase domain-containing protein [Patescibacteria group bacterium]
MKAFTAPAVESLLHYSPFIWPGEVSDNQEFKRLVNQRLDLCRNVEHLLDLLSQGNKTIMELKEDDDASLKKIIAAYNGLADFMSECEANGRIIFYLPFEMIPDLEFVLGENELQQAANNFLSAYLKVWRKFMYIHELRVNFVDGDILESGPRHDSELFVCKAAHLIPVLLQKKSITFAEVVKMFKASSTQTLTVSLVEAILAANDLKIISDDQLRISADPKILSCLFTSVKPQAAQPEVSIIKTGGELASLIASALKECLRNRFFEVSPERMLWLEEVEKQKIINNYAEVIADSVTNNHLSLNILMGYFNLQRDVNFLLLAINTLRLTVEKMNKVKLEFAVAVAYYAKSWLHDIWLLDSVDTKKAIESALHRWFNAGIIDNYYLLNFDLKPVNLAGEVLSENVCSSEEFCELTKALNYIRDNESFSKYFYPVFNLYGSRVKGYGSKFTDIDLAVFVKPGIDPSEKELVTSVITKILKHEKIKGRVLQFWLASHEEYLTVGNYFNGDKLMGNSSYAHVLFGGAWFGDLELVKELHAKLLTPYLFTENKALRDVCLRELERDNLQYRLLHKGYDYLFPAGKRLVTQYIDANCAFYDSGYRMLATKLFLKKVFLPRLGV